jgi:hypothetical protein
MGKVFKKITKPIAKVFDKIIPNEIKPALPYLAAVAPFMLPAGFTIGGLSSQLSRAIASGAINLGSQAAQEGAAERGINPLSLALAAGSGYLSTPGAGESLTRITNSRNFYGYRTTNNSSSTSRNIRSLRNS